MSLSDAFEPEGHTNFVRGGCEKPPRFRKKVASRKRNPCHPFFFVVSFFTLHTNFFATKRSTFFRKDDQGPSPPPPGGASPPAGGGPACAPTPPPRSAPRLQINENKADIFSFTPQEITNTHIFLIFPFLNNKYFILHNSSLFLNYTYIYNFFILIHNIL